MWVGVSGTVGGRDAAVEPTGVNRDQTSGERPYMDGGAGAQAQQGLRSTVGIHGVSRLPVPMSRAPAEKQC